MPTTQTSPNMGIVVPVVGVEPGPTWASDLYTALFTTIDGHDHTTGKGKPIVPGAMNINADLPFGSNNATALRSARFAGLVSPLSGGSDLDCVYAATNSNPTTELWYNDSAGRQVQLTGVGALFPRLNCRTVTGNYLIDSTPGFGGDTVILCNFASPFTVTLPTGTPGRQLIVADISGNAQTNPITIGRRGAETLDGVASGKVLAANWGNVHLVCYDGTNWITL